MTKRRKKHCPDEIVAKLRTAAVLPVSWPSIHTFASAGTRSVRFVVAVGSEAGLPASVTGAPPAELPEETPWHPPEERVRAELGLMAAAEIMREPGRN